MADQQTIETIARQHGCEDFAWITGADVQVRQWVRFKCTYGCNSYGRKWGCPPAVPSVGECREFFSEYERILVLHLAVRLDHPDDRKEWSRKKNLELLALERAVFLSGCHKAFLLFMDECRICAECPGTREACKSPAFARPCPEALGVDLFATVRSAGFPIDVLKDYDQEMNRYAFLLVE